MWVVIVGLILCLIVSCAYYSRSEKRTSDARERLDRIIDLKTSYHLRRDLLDSVYETFDRYRQESAVQIANVQTFISFPDLQLEFHKTNRLMMSCLNKLSHQASVLGLRHESFRVAQIQSQVKQISVLMNTDVFYRLREDDRRHLTYFTMIFMMHFDLEGVYKPSDDIITYWVAWIDYLYTIYLHRYRSRTPRHLVK